MNNTLTNLTTKQLIILSSLSCLALGSALGVVITKTILNNHENDAINTSNENPFAKDAPVEEKDEDPNKPIYIYVSGDRSHVGKSTTCLALIHSLIVNNILLKEEICYIKPCTQCISPTMVSRYCLTNNIFQIS